MLVMTLVDYPLTCWVSFLVAEAGSSQNPTWVLGYCISLKSTVDEELGTDGRAKMIYNSPQEENKCQRLGFLVFYMVGVTWPQN